MPVEAIRWETVGGNGRITKVRNHKQPQKNSVTSSINELDAASMNDRILSFGQSCPITYILLTKATMYMEVSRSRSSAFHNQSCKLPRRP